MWEKLSRAAASVYKRPDLHSLPVPEGIELRRGKFGLGVKVPGSYGGNEGIRRGYCKFSELKDVVGRTFRARAIDLTEEKEWKHRGEGMFG